MEIEYTLRPEDLRAYTRYYRKLPSVQPRLSRLMALGMVVIMLAWVSALIIADFFFKEENLLVGMFIGSFGVLLWQGWWHFCWYRSFYKAQCEDPRSEWAVRDVQVFILPDQLRTVCRGSAATYHWPVVWHIGVTSKHVFLFLTGMNAIIIPRRVFRDTAHCEEFIALARQYRRDWLELKRKPTGIITSLPPDPTAITSPDLP
jgi:hypothetical protein